MLINCLLASFLLGIFLADKLTYDPVALKILLSMLVLLLAVSFLWRKDKVVRTFSLSSASLIFALLYFQFFIPKPTPDYISYYNGQVITLLGEVVEEPQKEGQKTKLFVKVNGIKGRILVNAPLFPEYHYGDRLKIKGKLEEPPVFDEFNYKNYLKTQKVYSIINNPKTIEKLGEIKGFSIKKLLLIIKNHFEATINKILPEPEAALANGILLGKREDIPDWLIQAFIAAGVVHIIALSGYNISVIAKYSSILFNSFLPSLTFYLALGVVWAFVAMVGASASIVRAALMGSMYLIAHKVGRRREMIRILLITAFLMILQNPFVLKYDSGFQLSFLATVGLVYLSPVLTKWINWQLPQEIKEAGVATISAQVFTLPLLLFNFKQISLISPLSNILIVPLVPYAMFFVFLAGVAGMIFLPLGQVVGWLAFLFLKYMILISVSLAKIPGAYWQIEKVNFLIIFAYWLILGLILVWLNRKN